VFPAAAPQSMTVGRRARNWVPRRFVWTRRNPTENLIGMAEGLREFREREEVEREGSGKNEGKPASPLFIPVTEPVRFIWIRPVRFVFELFVQGRSIDQEAPVASTFDQIKTT